MCHDCKTNRTAPFPHPESCVPNAAYTACTDRNTTNECRSCVPGNGTCAVTRKCNKCEFCRTNRTTGATECIPIPNKCPNKCQMCVTSGPTEGTCVDSPAAFARCWNNATAGGNCSTCQPSTGNCIANVTRTTCGAKCMMVSGGVCMCAYACVCEALL